MCIGNSFLSRFSEAQMLKFQGLPRVQYFYFGCTKKSFVSGRYTPLLFVGPNWDAHVATNPSTSPLASEECPIRPPIHFLLVAYVVSPSAVSFKSGQADNCVV